MELIFTGRGAAFNVIEGNTNAYFIENNKLFLIDCGETVFEALRKHDLFTNIKEVYTLISHTHSDHCGSLGSVGFYCQYVLGTKLKIVVPHDEAYNDSLRCLMKIFGNTENAYEMIYEEEIDGMFTTFDSVRYDQTQHDRTLTCYSFVFETKKGAVFYSSDTSVIDNLMKFTKTHNNIDKIYLEVTDVDAPNDIHLSLNKLVNTINDDIKSKIYMMHLRNETCKQRVIEEGFEIVDYLR